LDAAADRKSNGKRPAASPLADEGGSALKRRKEGGVGDEVDDLESGAS